TPVAVAYAGTETPDELRPRSTAAALLGRAVPCSPCRQLRCPYGHECLDVPPGTVAAAALDLARHATATHDLPEEDPCAVPATPCPPRPHPPRSPAASPTGRPGSWSWATRCSTGGSPGPRGAWAATGRCRWSR